MFFRRLFFQRVDQIDRCWVRRRFVGEAINNGGECFVDFVFADQFLQEVHDDAAFAIMHVTLIAFHFIKWLFANGFAVASDAGESDAGASDAGEPDSCESDAPGSAAVDSANSVPKSNVSASDVGGRSQLGSNVGSGPEPGTAQEQTF